MLQPSTSPINLLLSGDTSGRGLLSSDEAVDGEPEPVVGRAGMGAHVVGHRAVRVLPEPHEGLEPVSAHQETSHSHGLHPEAAEDD